MIKFTVILLIYCAFYLASAHNHDGDQHMHTQGKFGSHDDIHDVDHLKQHFEDQIEINNKTFDLSHSKFYYFNLHNLNRDPYIDGLELMKGITHAHAGAPLPIPMSDSEIEMMVDVVLNDFDTNGDGLIDYAEYIAKADRE